MSSENNESGPLGDLLSKIRVSQDFSDSIGVKKTIMTIPVRKPNKTEFVRVHPSEDMRIVVAMIELKEEREIFVVDRDLAPELPGEVQTKLLVTAINRQGVVFLWPLSVDLQGSFRKNHWSESALAAAELAQANWTKMSANMSLGAYDIFKASGNIPDPQWPDLTFQQILEIAFKDKFINSTDHIVIRKLRGEI